MATKISNALQKPAPWLFIIRLVAGAFIFSLGYRLLVGDGWQSWIVMGELLPQSVRGPFAGIFQLVWESPIVLNLVTWGFILIGAAFISGLFVRLAAIGGATMMLLFYLSNLPPQFGWICPHLVLFIIFSAIAALGSGYRLGLGYLLTGMETRYPFLKFVNG